ncbi:hypothetical protein [Polaribacter sp. L3A8]|uniref:hypothetical protein n=1 Tax=Polaribacter sp. L3A8 TaxID=2686361 RepID=UPI00131CC0C1|nr:hypothetical protein [Polaribacter sp. L3A8]
MHLEKLTLSHFILTLIIILSFSSCTKEDICTKEINVPIWNEEAQIFEDNFQDFPCDFNGITKSVSEFTLNEKKILLLNLKNKKTTEISVQSFAY